MSDTPLLLAPLLLTSVWSFLPTARHHAYACSSGSLGYRSFKEMLQNGTPGIAILLESDDLENIGVEEGGGEDEIAGEEKDSVGPDGDDHEPVEYDATILNDDDDGESEQDSDESSKDDHAPPPPLSFSLISVQGEPTPFLLEHISHITIFTNLQTIPDRFLPESSNLNSVDLSQLSHIRSIGKEFLFECNSLSSVTLPTPRQNQQQQNLLLQDVSTFFLAGCTGLKRMDAFMMSALSNITVIRNFFLYECSGLVEVDLSPLVNVVEVHDHFLSGCAGLTTLNIQMMAQVGGGVGVGGGGRDEQDQQQQQLSLLPPSLHKLHRGFLCECRGLRELDLSPLSHFTEIAPYFLANCTGLTTLDLTPLSKVTQLPEGVVVDWLNWI